jgi:predicted porin
LKGTYKLEYEVNPDRNTNGNGLRRRNQYAGLKGGFGEFRFGRHDTPTKLAQGKFDEFNDTDADIKGVLSMSRAENRLDNIIAYLSPDFSGFTFGAAIAPGEGNGCKAAEAATSNCTDNKGGDFGGDGPADIVSLAGTYKMAGLMVSLGYDMYDTKVAGTKLDINTSTIGDIEDYLDGPTAGGDFESLMRLVATYKMDMFGAGLLYESSAGNSDYFGEDKTITGLSGHVSLAGGHKIKLQYMMSSQDLSMDDGTGTKITPAEVEETQISLGYDFKMGKATTAYAMYTQATDEIKVKSNFGGDTLEREYSFIGVGLIQNF